MKRYSASELRAHVAEALDEVERGQPVVVERRGRRFRIVAEPSTVSLPRRIAPFFEIEPELLDAGWSWSWERPGRPLRLRAGQRRTRARRR